MKAFVSWSGGKDCSLALYRFQAQEGCEIHALLNMCDETGQHSGSHAIPSNLLQQQASCMGLPLIQQPTSRENYRDNFKRMLELLGGEGVNAGFFGDINLLAHREWIEDVCAGHSIKPLFPLWALDTREVLRAFINDGFKAVTVAVKSDSLSREWLGRELNHAFYNDITAVEGIDACAENGEYHTFVFDGPLFTRPVRFIERGQYLANNNYFLSLDNV